MAYTGGDLILDDHYNLFISGNIAGTPISYVVKNVQAVWGGSVGDIGYGQTGPLLGVSAGSTITATKWTTLLNRISTIASHQNSGITGITNPAVGNTIEAYAALQANVDTIWDNRLNCHALQSSLDLTTSRTADWTVSVTMTQTITFSSEADVRDFFNSGGIISVSASRTGGTAHDKNTGWTDLLTAMGTIYLSSSATAKTIAGIAFDGTTKVGGSGTPSILRDDVGYHQLTGTDVAIFRQYDTSANYTANYVTVYAKQVAEIVTLTTIFTDAAADEAYNPELDTVDGTLSTFLKVSQPSTTYIANSWGLPALGGSETGS